MKTALKAAVVIGALVGALGTPPTPADMEDDPLLAKLEINQLEMREADHSDPLRWDIDAWLGKDLHKLWIKSEGERAGGKTESAELQILYSRAVAPYWDFQVGWRRDRLPEPERNWLAFGFEGLAPYFLEVDAAMFIGESGHTAFRIDVERELLFTQKLILEPEIKLNFHSRNDQNTGTGAGLSDVEISLRLHYAINRQFAPYIGASWERKVGNTANYARDRGRDTDDLQWVAGVSAWF